MNRQQFLRMLALTPLMSQFSSLSALNPLLDWNSTPTMPILFLGHGSPMNAIEENDFVRGFRRIAANIPTPNAILCISAHWETKGTRVTAMQMPRTIHDFGGFPPALHQVQYPAPGSPKLAQELQSMVTTRHIELDHHWGLDHGAWSVIKHFYPKANIPTIQLSLDLNASALEQYELAQLLSSLRQKGVLIIGSGNMVHNLSKLAWSKLNGGPYAFDWASEANELFKSKIASGDFQSLIHYQKLGSAVQLAIPTREHYLPLLYILALVDQKDEHHMFNDEAVGGSLTMTSYLFT